MYFWVARSTAIVDGGLWLSLHVLMFSFLIFFLNTKTSIRLTKEQCLVVSDDPSNYW